MASVKPPEIESPENTLQGVPYAEGQVAERIPVTSLLETMFLTGQGWQSLRNSRLELEFAGARYTVEIDGNGNMSRK